MADVTANSASKNFYSIEAPGVIRSNAKYNVAVNILEAKEPCSIRLNLSGDNYSDEKSLEVQPMTTEVVTFDIPEIEAGDYFFEATGVGALIFNQKIKLNFAENKPLTYIQLDKQSYKPCDNVDFRVLFLDNNIRPAEISKPIKITIEHIEDKFATVFENIELKSGVYTGQWTIPEDITSGYYMIKVYVGEHAITEKEFEIFDFKEPKFNIVIKGSRKVRFTSEYVNIGIEAYYPDGTPVKGRCTIEVQSNGGYSGLVASPIEKYMDIDGTVENIMFSILEDLKIDNNFNTEPYYRTASMSLDVTVVDEKNNITETLTEILTITKNNDKKHVMKSWCGSCGGCICEGPEETPPMKEIVIKTLDKSPKLGEPISFDVILNKPTNYFVYVFTARGNIIKSEVVILEEGTSKHTIIINGTFELVPRAFLLAYYVSEGELFFDEIGFDLDSEFENKLSVKAPSTNEAGKEITIDVTSDPNSLIGVMAIDVNSKLPDYNNDLNSTEILEALRKIYSRTPWLDGHGAYPGIMSGLVTFTNASWKGFEKGDPDGMKQNMSDWEHLQFNNKNQLLKIRRTKDNVEWKMLRRNQTFGNLMFFNRKTADNGNLTITAKLPDKSTTWLLTVFAMHPNTGFAMTKSALEIKAISNSDDVNDQEATEVDISPKATTTRIQQIAIKFDGDLYEQLELSSKCDLELPEEATEVLTVEFRIGQNLIGPVIADITKNPPNYMYCNGMLHITTYLPNVVVLEFLQFRNQLDSEPAKNRIAQFAQVIPRELTDRRDDGSFGWYASDQEGSPHVTAAVIRTFQRISKFTDIDPKVIKEGLDYLVTRQTENGDFIREAEPYNMPFQPNLNVGLTATILLTFIEDKENISRYQNTIDRAVDYIVTNLPATNCGYDLALVFYALQKLQHPIAIELKDRLLSTTCEDTIRKWWVYSKNDNTEADNYVPISDLEVTSYVLLGLLETESIESLVPIVKWLLPYCGHKVEYRSESMDPAISLEAVLNFAIKSGTYFGVTNIQFTAFGEEEYQGAARIDPSNANVTKTYVLPNKTRKVCYSTKDKGSFEGNLTYRYSYMDNMNNLDISQ